MQLAAAGLAAVFAVDAITVSWAPSGGGGAVSIPAQLERGGLTEEGIVAVRILNVAFLAADVARLLPRTPARGDQITIAGSGTYAGTWVLQRSARTWTDSDPHGLLVRLEAEPL